MKKIIIAYASYGGGHFSAAKNIKEYIENNYSGYEVILFDCMKYINRVIDKVCGKTYSKITTDIPWFWGKIYYHTQDPIFEKILSLSNIILSYKLRRLIRQENPDIIISTHFFVSHMFSILKQKKKFTFKLATIITDYGDDPYNEWISNHEFVDYIFVAHSNMKKTLVEKGVLENKVFDTGIPISSRFLENYNKDEILNTYNFDKNKKTILFFGGGEYGLGKSKTLKIFENLISEFSNIQVIAIAGKNESLKNTFTDIVNSNNTKNNNIVILGFSNEIPQLMSISDFVITKPGGLTTTECLVSNLPVLVINPIPGQEEENADFLERNNVAIYHKKNNDINLDLSKLINDDRFLFKLKQNTYKIAKPHSTENICKILFNN